MDKGDLLFFLYLKSFHTAEFWFFSKYTLGCWLGVGDREGLVVVGVVELFNEFEGS